MYKRVEIQTEDSDGMLQKCTYVVEIDPSISSLIIPIPEKPWIAMHGDFIITKKRLIPQGAPVYNETRTHAQVRERDLLDPVLCWGIDNLRVIAEYQQSKEFLDYITKGTSLHGEFRGTRFEIVDLNDKPFLVMSRGGFEIKTNYRFSSDENSFDVPEFENIVVNYEFPYLGYENHALTPMYDLQLLESMYNRIVTHRKITPQIEHSTDKHVINRLLERIKTLERTRLPGPSRRTTW